MTKKERVNAVLDGKKVDGVPASFSLHFPKEAASGKKAVQAHLDFFKKTDTDILKIMNEQLVPDAGEIKTPDDWKNIPSFSIKSDFIQKQIELTKQILDKCDPSGFTMGTIHGIAASSIHPFEHRYGYIPSRELVCAHARQKKQPVLDAFSRITEGLSILTRAYLECGLDAVYYAALGGEKHFFTDEEFAEFYEPFDRLIIKTAKENGARVFLHICKENLNMNRYKEYSADAVNWGTKEVPFSLKEGRTLFGGTTIFGGLANRSGVLVDGTENEIAEAVRAIIRDFGTERFILGADCTLPTEIPYKKVRSAVDAARNFSKS